MYANAERVSRGASVSVLGGKRPGTLAQQPATRIPSTLGPKTYTVLSRKGLWFITRRPANDNQHYVTFEM